MGDIWVDQCEDAQSSINFYEMQNLFQNILSQKIC